MDGQAFGVIGLEVMGRNLALNVERNGFPVALHNRTHAKTTAFLEGPGRGKRFRAAETIEQFITLLQRPRRILLMVKAGPAVDAVLAQLRPHLEEADIVIDGGNSLFTDTRRRAQAMGGTGIRFLGMGISGGEEGALWGPSLMPGGDEPAYRQLEPILTRIAAKAPDDGHPCVAYLGSDGCGHFVKMVHNGIEYGDMQLIAEAYDLLKHVGGLENAEMAEVFAEWNEDDDLKSYLIEITAQILDYRDETTGPTPLVELILDAAGQKGTGRWTVQAAMDLGVPIPTITAAVDARALSAMNEQRQQASRQLSGPAPAPLKDKRRRRQFIQDVRAALSCAKVCSYAQGFALLQAADAEYGFGLRIGEVARIWEAGCIIRAALLKQITEAIAENPKLPNLLLAERFRQGIAQRQEGWRRTVQLGVTGLPLPAMSASLAFYDSYRRQRLPANLIQAQRDFFGAHTYQRIDTDGTFHTQWKK